MAELLSLLVAIRYFLNELVYAGNAESTIKAYKSDLNQFREFINKSTSIRYIDKVAPVHISKYREYMIKEKEFKSKTVKRKLDTLAAFFDFLLNQGYIDTNPVAKVRISHLQYADESKTPRCISYDEISAIINAARIYGGKNAKRDVAILTCMAYLGTRRSDALNLDWSDVDFTNKTIHLRRVKTNNEDILPMAPDLYDALFNYYSEIRPDPWQPIFLTQKDNRISFTRFNTLFKRYVSKSGISKDFNITSHVFRHSFCSYLVSNGASLAEIQAYTGHRDLNSLRIYTHVSTEAKCRTISKLPSIVVKGENSK